MEVLFEAGDGQELLERIDFGVVPDVILMDLQMPVLDGFTATSLIRRIESICRVPVIAVSAQSTEDFIAAAKRVGCDGFVPKPVDFDVLLKLIRECTEAADAQAFDAPPDSVTVRQPCV
jgi:CheY-like chemotaxis protein